MNCLIVYMSHHGTTEKIARDLALHLGEHQTRLVNLKDEVAPSPDLFDTIIIGGSIHGGQIQSRIKEYCEKYLEKLLSKRVGLFMCSMSPGKDVLEFNAAFPEVLRQHAVAHGLFGGELLLEKMNFVEKLMVKTMSGRKKSYSALNTTAIEEFKKKISG